MNFPMIDTHTHLYDSAFDLDLEAVLLRAQDAGVRKIISVSECLGDARKNLTLAEKYKQICIGAGLYPAFLNFDRANEMVDFVRNHRDKLVAIGEVGLDYWIAKSESDRETQRDILSLFIDLSLELDLPLNVHSRSAGRQAINFLIEKGATRVQLHAYDGKAHSALTAVEAGYFISIPPSIVRSRQKQKLVKRISIENLLLETDSPVLGPVKNQRNEPSHLIESVRMIAEIKNIPEQTVREITLANASKLYGNI